MSRHVMTRIVALLVVTAVGLYYILFDAVGIKLTNKPFSVQVVLPAAGGIYTDASVTYRGVDIGKVTGLHLQPGKVIAVLAINHGAKIPADSTASVRELTAAAEQYMDLVPANSDPPYLHAGSVIPESHTSIPVSIGTVLDTVNSLLGSLHASDLNTVSSAFAEGLQGAGDDLRSIISDSRTLLDALQTAIPGTVQLIDAGHTALSTLNATGDEFADFTSNLNLITDAVARSNSDLVALLHNGAAAGPALDRFLVQSGRSTTDLIDNLGTITTTAFDRQGAFQALLQVLPLFATDIASTSTNGQVRFELTFNGGGTVCPYTSTMEEPTSLVAKADLTRNCATRAPDLLQRGADKAPPPGG